MLANVWMLAFCRKRMIVSKRAVSSGCWVKLSASTALKSTTPVPPNQKVHAQPDLSGFHSPRVKRAPCVDGSPRLARLTAL